MTNSQLITLCVAVDLAVTIPILVWVLRKRVSASIAGTGMDLGRLREFTTEIERTAEEHLRTNWSGDASTLPLVLTALMAQVEARTREEGYPIERPLLKRLVGQVLESKHLVGSRELRDALKQVA